VAAEEQAGRQALAAGAHVCELSDARARVHLDMHAIERGDHACHVRRAASSCAAREAAAVGWAGAALRRLGWRI